MSGRKSGVQGVRSFRFRVWGLRSLRLRRLGCCGMLDLQASQLGAVQGWHTLRKKY